LILTHVDSLFLKPTISVTYLDGSSRAIIKDGEFKSQELY